MNGQVMNPKEDMIFLCVQDCSSYYVNNLFMLIHEWRCEDIISWVLLKTGLTWSWEVFFWLWALKTIEAKKQLLPIFRALQTYRMHP